MNLPAGTQVLDRYVVDRTIGQGGMGSVYLGHHCRLGMPVALKVLTLPQDDNLAQRFEREALLMARVKHPNVVSILDYGFLADGSPCIAMEYIQGEPLDVRIKAGGGLPWTDAVRVICDILAGLEALHAASVLHRDLKPANVLIASGRPEVTKLIDFGIAQPTGDDAGKLTRTGIILGTPAYMSPEQLLACPLDARTDIYATGLIFYEMLTGRPPFQGQDMASVLARLREVPEFPAPPAGYPAFPKNLGEVVLRLLSADPNRRPADCTKLLDALLVLRKRIDGAASGPVRTTSQPAPVIPGQPATRAEMPPRPVSPGPMVAPSSQPPVVGASGQGGSRLVSGHITGEIPDSSRAGLEAAGTAPTMLAPAVELERTSVTPVPASESQGLWNTGPLRNPTDAGQAAQMSGQRRPLVEPLMPGEPVEARVETRRFLLVSRLPSKLHSPAERQWLAQQAGSKVRSYTLASKYWFALQTEATSAALARSGAERLAATLDQRYGTTSRTAWALVDASFELSPLALSGASALPPELASLLEMVAG